MTWNKEILSHKMQAFKLNACTLLKKNNKQTHKQTNTHKPLFLVYLPSTKKRWRSSCSDSAGFDVHAFLGFSDEWDVIVLAQHGVRNAADEAGGEPAVRLARNVGRAAEK